MTSDDDVTACAISADVGDAEIKLSSAAMRRRIEQGNLRGDALRAAMVATVRREREEREEQRVAAAAVVPDQSSRSGRRSAPGERAGDRDGGEFTSVVLSLRLGVEKSAMLQERAAAVGLTPSALARNLIRVGLRGDGSADVATIVDQLGRQVERLRTALA